MPWGTEAEFKGRADDSGAAEIGDPAEWPEGRKRAAGSWVHAKPAAGGHASLEGRKHWAVWRGEGQWTPPQK